LTQHNGQVAFFIDIEPSLTSTIILEEDEIGNTITYDLIKTLVKYDMFSFLETFVHETFIPKKDLWSKIVRQSISISEENRWLENIENRPELLRYSKIHSTLTTDRVINVPAYTCSFLFSMNVSPSRTEISESFCCLLSSNQYTMCMTSILFTLK
jgi:hypothetical protein